MTVHFQNNKVAIKSAPNLNGSVSTGHTMDQVKVLILQR
jgi:hypothetical protein